jgi:hypothetical protein
VGKDAGGGHLHALMRVRTEFRSILLEMGCVCGLRDACAACGIVYLAT